MNALNHDIVVAGGGLDPSLLSLAAFAERRGFEVLRLFHDKGSECKVDFDFETGKIANDGLRIETRSAFVRFDVFNDLSGGAYSPSNRASNWFAFAIGAFSTKREVAMLNRHPLGVIGSKLNDLHLAQSIGLNVPKTVVSNDYVSLMRLAENTDEWIAKPVGGGSYCSQLSHVMQSDLVFEGRLPNPAIVQERLSYPEFRAYRVGKKLLVFSISSEKLDYRADHNAVMRLCHAEEIGGNVAKQLFQLGDLVGLDFYACDLKTRKGSGELCFLELNSSPMFAAHDAISDGGVSSLILDSLLNPQDR